MKWSGVSRPSVVAPSVAGSFSIFLCFFPMCVCALLVDTLRWLPVPFLSFPYVCACRYGIGVRSGGFIFLFINNRLRRLPVPFLFLFVPMCVLVLVDTESASTTSPEVASIYL